MNISWETGILVTFYPAGVKISTSNPMATREIWDKFPEEIYKIRNFPSAAREI